MISESLLKEYGARTEIFDSKETIIQQGYAARNFYQIKTGYIQVTSINEDGKKFTQHIFQEGESFGEPALFTDIPYPGSAITLVKSKIIILPKESFFQLLNDHPRYYRTILKRLSLRLHYKSLISQVITNQPASQRVLTLIDYMKEKENLSPDDIYKVPLTRQQLADLIGLRVETVIRTIQQLKQEGEVDIKSGKIYR